MIRALLAIIGVLFITASSLAQVDMGPPLTPPKPVITIPTTPSGAPDFTGINPLTVLEAAGSSLPGGAPVSSSASGAPATGLSPALNVMLLLTVVSLAPSIMLMTTCFVRIIVVLGLLKQAIGTSTIPPPQVTVALALFMTMLVMTPTAKRIYNEAVIPHQQGEITNPDQLWDAAKQPLRDFMFDQIDATGNWSSVYMILDYRGIDTSEPEKLSRADVDMVSLIPAFMLSELKTAFLLGFRIYLPFLIIDMVISSLLISMSMMMLPPVMISLPFKLLLFVLVDGWTLVVGGLMRGFRTEQMQPVAETAMRYTEPIASHALASALTGADSIMHAAASMSHTLMGALHAL